MKFRFADLCNQHYGFSLIFVEPFRFETSVFRLKAVYGQPLIMDSSSGKSSQTQIRVAKRE